MKPLFCGLLPKIKLLPLLILGSVFFDAGIAIAGPPADSVYACAVTLETLHEDGGSSFQRTNSPSSPFLLKIGKAGVGDDLCADKKLPGFFAILCKMPMKATVQGSVSYYGGNNEAKSETFRGVMPYDYFVLFQDRHFLWSFPFDNGVFIRSGMCSAN